MLRALRSRPALLAAGLALLICVLLGPALAAADQIPRPPGAIDNRGYELVNPPDKNRNAVIEAGAVASADGNRVPRLLRSAAAMTRPPLESTPAPASLEATASGKGIVAVRQGA
jgi:hypothetical protein